MNKIIFFLLAMFLISGSLSATIYKGQSVFARKCVNCHTERETLIKTRKAQEWRSLLKENGKPLAVLHLKSKKAKKSWNYFNSKKYAKKVKHLRDFLVEYAKGSGKVPACN